MSDTFIGSVQNPTEAAGDITNAWAGDMANAANFIELVENGTVQFNYTSINIQVRTKNTGQLDGTFTVTLYRDNVQVEQKTISITGGNTGDLIFNNAAAGYANPEGETHQYKVTVAP